MTIITIILWLLKFFSVSVFGYNFAELSWGWVLMGFMMDLWFILNRPNNQ